MRRQHLFAFALSVLGTALVSSALMGIQSFFADYEVQTAMQYLAPFGIVAAGAWAFANLPGLLVPREPFLCLRGGKVHASWLQRHLGMFREWNSPMRFAVFASVAVGSSVFYGTGSLVIALLVAMGMTAIISLSRSGLALPRFAHDSMRC